LKYFPLIWAALIRRPLRSTFTLLSVVAAFVLFGMLQGVNAGFARAITDEQLDMLITDPRVPGGPLLPMSILPDIERVPGVRSVSPRATFMAYYQDQKNLVAVLAVDPVRWFPMRPGFLISEAHFRALLGNRLAIVATPAALKHFGWKVGDRIPLKSETLKRDGSPDWVFELVGTFDTATPMQFGLVVSNFTYFDAARSTGQGMADRFLIRVADPSRAVETAAAIDRLSANSSHETRTHSQKELAESRLKQVGDVQFLTNSIVAAVFFSLLFVTGNTMRQSVRERTSELAVLRTLGFQDASILFLVLTEAILLCVFAAAIGLSLAAVAAPFVRTGVTPVLLSPAVVGSGLAAAAFVGILSAIQPAVRAMRLRVVDALAGR
jgi:putative ABC transport system permease protein